MAVDALDPGPNGDYPYWPRLPDGSPDPTRMPTGKRWQRDRSGNLHLIDITTRDAEGTEIIPPTLGGGANG